ncbi:MAG TPA: hypothetical protein PLG50_09550 [bacterium]|nr:hypothetical protein [bacterium]HQG45892.1 hypothetical protein [bacterium]HQI47971.1 hypothetical protein [bacterium]HQJ65628.1 hypothetical protein [bacterium]
MVEVAFQQLELHFEILGGIQRFPCKVGEKHRQQLAGEALHYSFLWQRTGRRFAQFEEFLNATVLLLQMIHIHLPFFIFAKWMLPPAALPDRDITSEACDLIRSFFL